jgi:hypothetical protein
MKPYTLLKDLVIEKEGTIGRFFRKNIHNKLMPSRDKLYRIMNKDIRDTEIRDVYAILCILDYTVDQQVLIIGEVLRGEKDYDIHIT